MLRFVGPSSILLLTNQDPKLTSICQLIINWYSRSQAEHMNGEE